MEDFSGESSFNYIKEILKFGPRPSGSKANLLVAKFISSSLKKNNWDIIIQSFKLKTINKKIVQFRNILGIKKGKIDQDLMLGAHFDSRPYADQEKNKSKHNTPILGANDDASGVGVLLEITRILKDFEPNYNIKILFTDAEDYEKDIEKGMYGAKYFVSRLTKEELKKIKSFIFLDMVGDYNLSLPYELNSDIRLFFLVRNQAERLGFEDIMPSYTSTWIIDDHIPFKKKGIVVLNLIHLSNKHNLFVPYWHTTKDTLDKISPVSLEKIGKILVETIKWFDKNGFSSLPGETMTYFPDLIL